MSTLKEITLPYLPGACIFLNADYLVYYVCASEAKEYSVIYVFDAQGQALHFTIDPHLRTPRGLYGNRLAFDPDSPPDALPQEEFDLETKQWLPALYRPLPDYYCLSGKVHLVYREGKAELLQAKEGDSLSTLQEQGLELLQTYEHIGQVDAHRNEGVLVFALVVRRQYRDVLLLGRVADKA